MPAPQPIKGAIHCSRHGSSWDWTDAFDIENGSRVSGGISAPVGRTEQNNPAVNFTGTWFLNTGTERRNRSALHRPGSRATITFAGTGIKWLAYRDAWYAIAKSRRKSTVAYFETDQAQL